MAGVQGVHDGWAGCDMDPNYVCGAEGFVMRGAGAEEG